MKLLRNYLIGFLVVALVAVGFAFLSGKGHLTRGDEVVLFPENPLVVNQDEPGREELSELFEGVVRRATPLEQKPTIPEDTYQIPLQTRTSGGLLVGAYSLYVVSMIDRNAVLYNFAEDQYYKLSVGDFERLFSTSAFTGLEKQRYTSPQLTLNGDSWDSPLTISPQGEELTLFTANGSTESLSRRADSEPPVLPLTRDKAAQKPEFKLLSEPKAWTLTLENGTDTIVTQDRVKTSELVFPSEPGEYTYTLTAHWNLSTTQDWYGEVTYVLKIHITEPEPETDLPENPAGETPNP